METSRLDTKKSSTESERGSPSIIQRLFETAETTIGSLVLLSKILHGRVCCTVISHCPHADT
jgi:hypothetical protein